jgi:ABC-type uncharacterized transport system permease subunit
MNKQEVYKRIKINWWIILILIGVLAGALVHMTFSYIHQWGNRPLDKTGFIISGTIMAVVFIGSGLFGGRFIVKIDDKFVIFRTDFYIFCKIPIAQIKNINIERLDRVWLGGAFFSGKYTERIHFDFVRQAVSIQTKNGITYQIAIKDAQKVKEEIEKRMTTTNKT